jgi:hypothetical protein
MEIKHIVVTVRQPSGDRNDRGSCEEAHYTVENGVLMLVDANGELLRGNFGELITHRMEPGESERTIASRLVLARWRASDSASDFNRPLRYPSVRGVV